MSELTDSVWVVSVCEGQSRGNVHAVFDNREAALWHARTYHYQLVEGESLCVEGFPMNEPGAEPTVEWIERPELVVGERSLPEREGVIDVG
jgi:hypothetical protein